MCRVKTDISIMSSILFAGDEHGMNIHLPPMFVFIREASTLGSGLDSGSSGFDHRPGDDGGAAQVDLRRCLGSEAAECGWPSMAQWSIPWVGQWLRGSSHWIKDDRS